MLRIRLQHMGLRIFSMIVVFGVFLSLSYRLIDSFTYLYLSSTAFFLFIFNLFWHPQFFQFSVMKVGRNKTFRLYLQTSLILSVLIWFFLLIFYRQLPVLLCVHLFLAGVYMLPVRVSESSVVVSLGMLLVSLLYPYTYLLHVLWIYYLYRRFPKWNLVRRD